MNWYDIAGSLHYRPETTNKGYAVWDYTAVYEHPEEEENTTGVAVPYTSTFKIRPSIEADTESGTVAVNNWHRHSYFPLYSNYFVALNGRTSALDGLLNPISGLTTTGFGAYQAETSSSRARLTLKGVKLVPPKTNNANSTAPDDFLFGYFDCHPNGLRSGAQVNPYTTGRTGNDNSNGDPIDISWAVYPAGRTDTAGNDISGNPANLDAIRYVRCYTGVMQMNGIMGESSSELLGSHKAVTKGTGAATTDLVVRGPSGRITTTNGGNLSVAAGQYRIISSEENVLLDGVKISASSAYVFTIASGEVHQIITQNGTEAPYITVLREIGRAHV